MKLFVFLICTLFAVVCYTGNAQFLRQRGSAPFSLRSDAVGVTMRSSMLILGGSGTSIYNDIWRSDDSGLTWNQTGTFPVPISQSAGVYFDARFSAGADSVVVYGGLTTNSYQWSNQVWLSTNRGQAWNEIFTSSSRLWSPRYGHTVSRIAILGQSTYFTILTGGYDGVYKNDVYCLNGVSTGTWTALTSAPWDARYGHTITSFNQDSRLIMAGGKSGNAILNDAWMGVFNYAQQLVWTELTKAASFTGRYCTGIVSVNDHLYIFGGAYGRAYNDVWISMNGGYNWTFASLSANYSPRRSSAYFVVGKELILVGGAGSYNSGPYLNDIWSGFLA